MAPTVNEVAHGVVGIPLFLLSMVTICIFWRRRHSFPIAGRLPVLAATGSFFAALTAFAFHLSAFTGWFNFPWVKGDPKGTCLYIIPISHALSASVFISMTVRCWMLFFKAQSSKADLRSSMARAAQAYAPIERDDKRDGDDAPAPYAADALVRGDSIWSRLAYLGSDRFGVMLMVFLSVAFLVYPSLDFALNPDHDDVCQSAHTQFILAFVTILHIGGALAVVVFCIVLYRFNDGLGVRSEFAWFLLFSLLGGTLAHRLENIDTLKAAAQWVSALSHFGFVYATIWRPLLRSNLPIRTKRAPSLPRGRTHSRSNSGVELVGAAALSSSSNGDISKAGANGDAPPPSSSSDTAGAAASGADRSPHLTAASEPPQRPSSPSRAGGADAPNGVSIDTIFSAPRLAMSLLEHAVSEFSGENVLFMLEVSRFSRAVNQVNNKAELRVCVDTAHRLYDTYIRGGAARQVSLPEDVLDTTRERMSGLDGLGSDLEDTQLTLAEDKTLLLGIFADAYVDVRRLVEKDTWQRFIQGQRFTGQYGVIADIA